jgi:hypothetical protein
MGNETTATGIPVIWAKHSIRKLSLFRILTKNWKRYGILHGLFQPFAQRIPEVIRDSYLVVYS